MHQPFEARWEICSLNETMPGSAHPDAPTHRRQPRPTARSHHTAVYDLPVSTVSQYSQYSQSVQSVSTARLSTPHSSHSMRESGTGRCTGLPPSLSVTVETLSPTQPHSDSPTPARSVEHRRRRGPYAEGGPSGCAVGARTTRLKVDSPEGWRTWKLTHLKRLFQHQSAWWGRC